MTTNVNPLIAGILRQHTGIEDTKPATTEERIATLRRVVEEAGAREKEAEMERHRALAQIAALDGDHEQEEYHLAYVASQTHEEGGHERFWRIAARFDARRVIAGASRLEDFRPEERPAVAAEVERLRAEEAPRSHRVTVLADDGETEVEVEPQH